MKFETKLKKIMDMPDSNEKLTEIDKLGLSLGIFNKEPIIKESNRLRKLGYKNAMQLYLEKKETQKSLSGSKAKNTKKPVKKKK